MENTLAGVAGKKFILSYSCGKDSTLCLHKMLEAGAEPMALLVMFNPKRDAPTSTGWTRHC